MPQPTTTTQIPLSKKKILLTLVGAIAFVVVGSYFMIAPETFRRVPFGSPAVIVVIGVAAIVFFGYLAIFSARKLFDSKPGLILDESGITDNTSALAAGHIPWRDIDRLSVAKVHNQFFLLIHVNDPEKYIERQKGMLKKKMMRMNFNTHGSPIALTAKSLKISFEELHQLIAEKARLNSTHRS